MARKRLCALERAQEVRGFYGRGWCCNMSKFMMFMDGLQVYIAMRDNRVGKWSWDFKGHFVYSGAFSVLGMDESNLMPGLEHISSF